MKRQRTKCEISGCDSVNRKRVGRIFRGEYYDRYCQQHMRYKSVGYFRDRVCSRCGFIPEASCQLTVDHINGNHKDNSVGNLQTLCTNCHTLKTFVNKEYARRYCK